MDRYPSHVSQILEDLNRGKDPVETLSSFISLLAQDSTLYFLYGRLGYIPETGSFAHSLIPREIIRVIQEEYHDAVPEDFPGLLTEEAQIKNELLQTFQRNGYRELSIPSELGLEGPAVENGLSHCLDASSPDAGRSNKGLKFLSLRVKEIIDKKGYVSYKKMADELIRDLHLQETPERGREEKNVLRRVYDALNVLIAVGVIKKSKKMYCWIGLSADNSFEALNERKDLIIQKQQENYIKLNNLRQLTTKFFALKELIQRNKETLGDSDKMNFPLIVLATEEHPTANIKIEFNRSSTNLAIKVTHKIKLLEDSDILLRMNLSQKYSDIPQGLVDLLNCKTP